MFVAPEDLLPSTLRILSDLNRVVMNVNVVCKTDPFACLHDLPGRNVSRTEAIVVARRKSWSGYAKGRA